MKQTVVWLALALLFAIGVTLSFTADSFGPTATAETTPPAPAAQTQAPQPVFAASLKPAEPDVPVVILDDVPPRPAVKSGAPARWFVEAGTLPSSRTADALIAPYPFAPTTTVALAGKPVQEAKADVKPPEADARPTKRPQSSNAQMPARRQTANTRACGSSSRWTDLLRRLNLASRCPTRRSAA
jgi:hypothetical protein